MRGPVGERRRQQALRLGLLRNRRERLHAISSAISADVPRDASDDDDTGRGSARRAPVAPSCTARRKVVVLPLDPVAARRPCAASASGLELEQERAVGQQPADRRRG